jgi:hypothetical protein
LGGSRVWTLGFALLKQSLEPHLQSIFCSAYFGDGVLGTICLGWPPTSLLPISASQVARITGMSHRCPVWISW